MQSITSCVACGSLKYLEILYYKSDLLFVFHVELDHKQLELTVASVAVRNVAMITASPGEVPNAISHE